MCWSDIKYALYWRGYQLQEARICAAELLYILLIDKETFSLMDEISLPLKPLVFFPAIPSVAVTIIRKKIIWFSGAEICILWPDSTEKEKVTWQLVYSPFPTKKYLTF